MSEREVAGQTPAFPTVESAAAAEPFTLPVPLEKSRRVLALFNNVEFEFETMSYVGPQGQPLIVIGSAHDSKGRPTQPHPMRWYAPAIAAQTAQFYASLGQPAIVLVRLEEPAGVTWKALGMVSETLFDAKDRPAIEQLTQAAQAAGQDPRIALTEAIRAGKISPPQQRTTPRLVDIAYDQLNELFAGHEAPAPHTAGPLGPAADKVTRKAPEFHIPKLPSARPARLGGWLDNGLGAA